MHDRGSRPMVLVLAAVSLLSAAVSAGEPAGPDDLRNAITIYGRAAKAESAGELEAARQLFRQARDLVPDSPHLIHATARLCAKLGDVAGCRRGLERLVAVSGVRDLTADPEFVPLLDREEFRELAGLLSGEGRPVTPAKVVVELQDPLFWSEGVAFDPVDGCLYLGSVSQHRVVRLADGREIALGSPERDGLMELLGLWVDVERRRLWAATGQDEPDGSEGPTGFAEAPRRNALACFDLRDGSLLDVHELPEDDRIHLLNDVVVTPDGVAYVTDTSTAEIFRLRPGGSLEPFRSFPDLNYLNGIAAGGDGRLLYVACFEGIAVIDLEGGGVEMLRHRQDLCLGLGDGIAVRGRELFIVQNSSFLGMRVLRCLLDESGREVVADMVLPCGMPDGLIPYTCAAGDDVLYVNGTSSFDLYERGEVPPAPVIVAIDLEPWPR